MRRIAADAGRASFLLFFLTFLSLLLIREDADEGRLIFFPELFTAELLTGACIDIVMESVEEACFSVAEEGRESVRFRTGMGPSAKAYSKFTIGTASLCACSSAELEFALRHFPDR